MRSNLILFPLILLFCAAFISEGWADIPVVVNVSQDTFGPQDEISLFAGVNEGINEKVDLYLALIIPGIPDIFYMGPDLGFYNEPIPIVSNWKPSDIPEIKLFTYIFTGQEPKGEYLWCGGMFYHGSSITAENLIGDISWVKFNFSADGIVDWFPKDGTVVQTTEPDLFLLFSKPVNKNSVIEHIEIKVESLGSGKVAEIKWIDGERYVIVDTGDYTIQQRISEDDYISPTWTEGDKKLTLHVGSYTIYGMTFSLHNGVSYELTFRVLQGASFTDGDPVPSRVIGPISFSVAD